MRSIRVTIRSNLPRTLQLIAKHEQIAKGTGKPFELPMPANDLHPIRRMPF